ncbi:MAG: DinB family protein, partial [Limnobacter sp.]
MNNKQSLLDSLQQSRERVLALVNSLSAQQTQVPYLPGINPPIWELGHAAFFFERFILQNLDGVPSYNPDLDDVWDSFELA